MVGGQAVLLWFIGSGIACILLLAWAAIAGLGAGRHRMPAFILLTLTAALAVLPTGLGKLRHSYAFPLSLTLFLGATLCLFAAVAVLWKLRRDADVKRSADLGIAACLNLWLALWATLTPLSYM